MNIVPYEPMGYLETTDNPPKFYNIPLRAVETVMESKNLPRDKRPEVVDLRKYGYGRESLSKIRGGDKLSESIGKIDHLIISQSQEIQLLVREWIQKRKSSGLVYGYDNVLNKIKQLTENTI